MCRGRSSPSSRCVPDGIAGEYGAYGAPGLAPEADMSESAPRSRAELLAAYRATSYEVIGADERIGARIGRQAPRVDELLRRHGAQSGTFITAWNPRSSPQPEEANAQAHARLAAHLDAAGRRQLPH